MNGNAVSVVYNRMYEVVARMIIQHYDTAEFDGCLFVVKTLLDGDNNIIDFRKDYPAKKYIYYQIDHLGIHPEYISYEHMNQFDEIWDFGVENLKYYPDDMKQKVSFMPMRYVEIPKIEPRETYKYDIGFVGTLTPLRQETICKLTKYWTNQCCSVKIMQGVPYSELYDDLAECKHIIDIQRDYTALWVQNQVRIMEALCSGKSVICDLTNNQFNYFSWIVYGYHNEYEILDLVKNDAKDNSLIYKDWTDSNQQYELMRQFILGDNYQPKLTV